MRFIPFEEKAIKDLRNPLIFSHKAEFISPHKSWRELARERDNFLKAGYRKSYGRFSDMWIADPRV